MSAADFVSRPDAWDLDSNVVFLNHGSFGACPRAVLAYQQELRAQLEAQPVDFMMRQLPDLWNGALDGLAGFLNADPAGLAFVSNATGGVNAVLRSLRFSAGDELLIIDHAYAACRNAVDFVAERWGAIVVRAPVPFPVEGPEQVLEAVLEAVTPRTRLAMIDHITSETGLVLPIEDIVRELQARGVDVLVDGAHAPGQVPLDLRALNAAYYTGNCHKWLCTPKGSAFLYVREDRRDALVPLTVSHGYAERTFRSQFDWQGTQDPTTWLSIPVAIEHLASLVPGGWPALMKRNRALVLEGRRMLREAFPGPATCPESMVASLATVRLPDGDPYEMNARLWRDHRVEAQFSSRPSPPSLTTRLSAQLYNAPADYERLIEALRDAF